ncbi:MAG: S24 family peptidase [Acidobacteria bacterium]|nr:S24 family peptidase [Acidobacteriota bacterium]
MGTNTDEVEFEESSEVWVAVTERVLPSWTRAAPLTCIRMAGDSMEATDAALLVVDSNRRAAVDGQLFVVLVVDALTVKRLRQVGDQWSLISDGSAHSPRPLRPDDRIVGRVAWRGPPGDAAR